MRDITSAGSHQIRDPRVLLIGGTSHTGKSTVAQLLSVRLGWLYRPTDKMARHPGRPWPTPERPVPPHVAEHYLTLPVADLIADVVRHYTVNVWPQVAALAEHHATDPTAGGLIVEGSAVLPELAADLNVAGVLSVWLTIDGALLAERMRASSQYTTRSARGKALIGKFLARAQAFNARTEEICDRLGLLRVGIIQGETPEQLAGRCLSALGCPELLD